MAVFRGTTSECLVHLFSIEFEEDVRVALAAFCQVSPATVQRWKTGENKPQGETLIKARHFLELLRYDVSELQELEPVVLRLGRALACKLTTVEQIAKALGYTKRPKSALEVLVGQHGLPAGRRQLAQTYMASLDDESKYTAFKRAFSMPVPKKDTGTKPEEGSRAVSYPRVPAAAANGHGEKKLMLEAAAHFVSGLIPIADFLLSDSCSKEDRKKLHELAGADSVLKLTTRLRRLCSETARRQLKDI